MLVAKKVIKTFELLCFMSILTQSFGAKILAVFPVPSISHQVVFRQLTQELAKRGHEVTVITPDPAFPNGGAPKNFKEIDIHDVSYQFWRRLFQEKHTTKRSVLSFTGTRQYGLFMVHLLLTQLKTPQVQQVIANKENKYDLIILEAAMRPALIFSHLFKAPTILVSSLDAMVHNIHTVGAPTHPLLYPSIMSKRIYNLSLSEKIEQLYTYYCIEYADYLNEADETKLFQQIFGPQTPPVSELYNNVDMLLVNVHPLWADARPVPPNVIYMGGIHQVPKQDLSKDLKTYLDSSKDGVIYLSFGTNMLAGMISQDKIKIFVEVLSQLPYDVLWKWDKDELPGKGNNIKISKWYPQSDLLRHPKIKLFITQAGLQSTEEAISAGVPLLGVPMIADQWSNGEKYIKHGIGKKLDIETVTAKELKAAIENVIKDESYRKNIIKLRELMQDQPEPPLQRVMWWVEYVIRHGGAKHLRSPAANISYADYFEIEVLAVIVLTVLTILITSVMVVCLLVKILKRSFGVKKKIKSN